MAGITQRIALKQQAETHSAVERIGTFAATALRQRRGQYESVPDQVQQ